MHQKPHSHRAALPSKEPTLRHQTEAQDAVVLEHDYGVVATSQRHDAGASRWFRSCRSRPQARLETTVWVSLRQGGALSLGVKSVCSDAAGIFSPVTSSIEAVCLRVSIGLDVRLLSGNT